MTQTSIKYVNHHLNGIYVVGLEAIDQDKNKFYPGQYMQLIVNLMDGNTANIPFTIASSPHSYPYLELHIRDTGGKLVTAALQSIKRNLITGEKQSIKMPYGNCYFERAHFNDDLLFISWGTGFAQAKSIIEYLLHNNYIRSIHLFQIVKNKKALYQKATLQEWSKLNNFQYQIVEHQKSDDQPLNLFRNTTNLCNVIFCQLGSLSKKRIFIAGPPNVVKQLIDELITRNIKLDKIHSDIHHFKIMEPMPLAKASSAIT